jgi:hypothetical protein
LFSLIAADSSSRTNPSAPTPTPLFHHSTPSASSSSSSSSAPGQRHPVSLIKQSHHHHHQQQQQQPPPLTAVQAPRPPVTIKPAPLRHFDISLSAGLQTSQKPTFSYTMKIYPKGKKSRNRERETTSNQQTNCI